MEIDTLLQGGAEPVCSIATGVYLGESSDGARGLVLTAAHPFLDDPDGGTNRPQRLRLFFHQGSSPAKAGTFIQVAARRAVIHPDCRYHRYDKPYAGTTLTTEKSMIDRDLAIVEFDAPSSRDRLAKARVQPVDLYDGTGYRRPLLEAEIVGFGLFGFSSSPALADRFKPYAGRTRVTYGEWRGSRGFLHWSPPRVGAPRMDPDPRVNTLQFALVEEPTHALNPFDKSPIAIHSHPEQALFAHGDSGGPLLFQSQGKLRVAGISSGFYGEFLFLGSALRPFHLQIWEPVKDSLEWIRAVVDGTPDASSRVVELGAGETKAGSGEDGFAWSWPCVIL
jgi:hypothetical protein